MAYFNEKVTINNATVDLVGTGAVLVPAGTTAQRPTPVAGQIRYNSDTAQFEGYQNGAWSTVGGSSELSVTQGTHGFATGDVLYHNGTIYVKAQADGTLAESQVVGVVKSAPTAGTFILQGSGYISGLSGLTAGTKYYLSGTAGAVTATKPTTVGHYAVEIYTAISTTEAIIAISESDNSQVLDSNFRINDDSAITKQLGFDISGNTAGVLTTVATAQTTAKTYTLQDVASSNFVMSEGTQTINGAKTFGTVPTLPTQTANTVFAGPVSGSSAAPAFRALVSGDIPSSDNLCNVFGDCEATLVSEDIASYITGGRTAGKWAYKTGASAIAEETTASAVLYGTKSYKALVTAVDEFIATPMFNCPVGYAGKAINLSFLLNTGVAAATTDYSVYVVRYTSAGAYAETLQVVGPKFLGIAQFTGFFIASTDYTDLYSVVVVYNTTPDVTLTVDQFYVGMNSVSTINVTENIYVYNTNITNADDTTSFATGSEGAAFPNRSVGTAVFKYVQFPDALQATDIFQLEYQETAVSEWKEGGQQFPYIAQGASNYGIALSTINSTTIKVVFSAQGARPNNATYAGNGQPWDNFYAAGFKWRIKRTRINSGVTALSSDRVKSIVRIIGSSSTISGWTDIAVSTVQEDLKGEIATPSYTTFTPKVTGRYRVSANLTTASTAFTAGNQLAFCIYSAIAEFEGSSYSNRVSNIIDANKTGSHTCNGTFFVKLNAGTAYRLRIYSDVSTTLDGTSNINIEQITDKDALGMLPISTENIVGRTTGVAPAAGFLGELKEGSNSSGIELTNATYTEVVNTGELSKGRWMLAANIYISTTISGRIGTQSNKTLIGISNTSAGTDGFVLGYNYLLQQTVTLNTQGFHMSIAPYVVDITTPTTKYLTVLCETSTAGDGTKPKVYGRITAVRIA